MLELRIKAGRRSLPIVALPAALGRQAAVREIGDQIDGLIAFLDGLAGDADLEPNGDETDASQPEWTGRRGMSWSWACARDLEDAEEDDPSEDDDSDCCIAGDDIVDSGPVVTIVPLWQARCGDDADAETTWTEDVRQPDQMDGREADDCEPRDGPPTLNQPMAANDDGPVS